MDPEAMAERYCQAAHRAAEDALRARGRDWTPPVALVLTLTAAGWLGLIWWALWLLSETAGR